LSRVKDPAAGKKKGGGPTGANQIVLIEGNLGALWEQPKIRSSRLEAELFSAQKRHVANKKKV